MHQTRFIVVAVIILVLAIWLLYLAAVYGAMGWICQAPPPGGHRGPTPLDFAWLIPLLVVLLVGEYLALGIHRVALRFLVSVLVLIATVVVGIFYLTHLTFGCVF